MNTVNDSFYLVVKGKRAYSGGPVNRLASPRITKTRPATKADEIAIKLKLTLPRSLFDEPQFEASILVDDSKVSAATVNADVLDNIEQLVMEKTGIQLVITDSRDEEDS